LAKDSLGKNAYRRDVVGLFGSFAVNQIKTKEYSQKMKIDEIIIYLGKPNRFYADNTYNHETICAYCLNQPINGLCNMDLALFFDKNNVLFNFIIRYE
jgi:hypothetical protein